MDFSKLVVAEALATASALIELAVVVGRFCETPIR
jgi:hypothetical protein